MKLACLLKFKLNCRCYRLIVDVIVSIYFLSDTIGMCLSVSAENIYCALVSFSNCGWGIKVPLLVEMACRGCWECLLKLFNFILTSLVWPLWATESIFLLNSLKLRMMTTRLQFLPSVMILLWFNLAGLCLWPCLYPTTFLITCPVPGMYAALSLLLLGHIDWFMCILNLLMVWFLVIFAASVCYRLSSLAAGCIHADKAFFFPKGRGELAWMTRNHVIISIVWNA